MSKQRHQRRPQNAGPRAAKRPDNAPRATGTPPDGAKPSLPTDETVQELQAAADGLVGSDEAPDEGPLPSDAQTLQDTYTAEHGASDPSADQTATEAIDLADEADVTATALSLDDGIDTAPAESVADASDGWDADLYDGGPGETMTTDDTVELNLGDDDGLGDISSLWQTQDESADNELQPTETLEATAATTGDTQEQATAEAPASDAAGGLVAMGDDLMADLEGIDIEAVMSLDEADLGAEPVAIDLESFFTDATDDALPAERSEVSSDELVLPEGLEADLEADTAILAEMAAEASAKAAAARPVEPEQPRVVLTELQELFLQEAQEYVDKLNQELLALEREGDSAALVASVLRSAHTLKGSAAMMRLTQMTGLAHALEDLLQRVRDEKLRIPAHVFDLLFESVDLEAAIIRSIRTTGSETDAADPTPLIARLNDTTRNLHEFAQPAATEDETEQEPVEAEKAEAEQEPIDPEAWQTVARRLRQVPLTTRRFGGASGEQSLRVDLGTLNKLVNETAELVIQRNRMTTELKRFEGMLARMAHERALLAQLNRRFQSLLARGGEGGGRLGREMGNTLSEFGESEFDRFSEFDVLHRDLRESISNLDDLGGDVQGLSTSLTDNLKRMSLIVNDLNADVVSMRLVSVKTIFTRFTRAVRDVAKDVNKDVNLILTGEETRLDKTLADEISEPLMHLVRNAIGHGIEDAETRAARHKSPTGRLEVKAVQDGNQVVFEVQDDGGGIRPDRLRQSAVAKGLMSEEEAGSLTETQAMELIFMPGFSTADEVSTLSGRGVGLDVVRTVISKMKGTVSVKSEIGRGTTFQIRLPLSLAVNQSVLIGQGETIYALSLADVAETIDVPLSQIQPGGGGRELITLRGQTMPVVRLTRVFNTVSTADLSGGRVPMLVVTNGQQRFGVIADRVVGREELVTKSLGSHLRKLPGLSGAAILGDGTVVLVMDATYLATAAVEGTVERPELITEPIAHLEVREEELASVLGRPTVATPAASTTRPTLRRAQVAVPRRGGDLRGPASGSRTASGLRRTRVLVVDDSVSIRKYVASLLDREAYDVVMAADGLDALDRVGDSGPFDLIMTDLEMPRMHGYELLTELRERPDTKATPVVILTARAGEKHRRRGLELGASAFLNKPFEVADLLSTLQTLIA